MQFSISSYSHILGDSPAEVVISSALIVFVFYWLWRIMIRPLIDVAANLKTFYGGKDLGVLEIIPPLRNESDPLSTESLIAALRALLGRHEVVSLEIAGTKKTGIRYRVVAAKKNLPVIQKLFASYIPELKFKQITPDTELPGDVALLKIKQSRHFAFPLKPHEDLAKADPVAFIAGSLTQLGDEEELVLQMALGRYSSKTASRLYRRLMSKGSVVLDGKLRYYLLSYAWIWVPALLVGLLARSWQFAAATALVFWITSLFAERKEVELTSLEEKLYAEIAAKLDQPLLRADLRFSVRSPERAGMLAEGFASSLAPLNTANFQQLVSEDYPDGLRKRHFHRLFSRRALSILPLNSSVLGVNELATLFHFPHGLIETEGMVRSHSRTLPAPLSLKNDPELDVVIGMNKHHGTETPIGLTEAERERHMFVVGGTGSGKTTMLKYQLVQDIRNGKGLAVIDPHGDLAEELLEYIPEERKKDLIYLNPDDLEHPLGVNLLKLPAGLTGNDLLREKDRVTESVISIMRKVFSEDDSGGHRIEYVLRNATQTALTLEKPTLFTIFQLLNDGKFAKDAIKNLEDENLKLFWKDELGKAGSMQKVKMTAGITAKIGRFLFSASARAMLEQEKSMIDFDEVLDGKILICNFSKGKLGEDTSMLFGVTVLAKLQLAALKRAERKQKDRKRFYIYVDEFQNFATLSFTQMLSEARKYRVFLTMAEQSTQQQDDQKMVDIILANVGTVVVFRTGSPKDEEYLLPLFLPYVQQGEISNLPAYNFYCHIAGLTPEEPMSGETVVVNDETVSID